VLDGIAHPSVVSYVDVIEGRREVGRNVAIIGAGGIGFDVAEFLTHAGPVGVAQDRAEWLAEWGVTDPADARGGLTQPVRPEPVRAVYLLQRKTSKVGAGLGRTTGWVHRATLATRGVRMLRGVTYERIDDAGLHVTISGEPKTLEVDDVVICAGQESRRELLDELRTAGASVHVVGGAEVATELDAKRAIDQGTRFAAAL